MERAPESISIVSPAYNEEESLPVLHEQLRDALAGMDVPWEWIVVDDHSSDRTFEVLCDLNSEDERVRGIRLSRNHGSHAAIGCALHHTSGECVVILAADLQDPPETIPALVDKWASGAHLVWAVRSAREGEKAGTKFFARLYHWLMSSVVGLHDMPPTGADFALLDRRVVETYRQFHESHVSIFALLTWMGFKHETLPYVKKARQHGTSGWTLKKKLKLVADSVLSFSFLPVRVFGWLGAIAIAGGAGYGGWLTYQALQGQPTAGWALVLIAVLVMGGLLLVMMSVLGQYLWRALDEVRRRPQFLVEQRVGLEALNEQRAAPER